jgi:hypothetical protein
LLGGDGKRVELADRRSKTDDGVETSEHGNRIEGNESEGG